MEKCTNHLCNCHRVTTSTAVHPFFTHYASPNIVIVPTVSFTDCPPSKKTKCSVECQNSTHANNIPIIPDTHMSCGVSSNNTNSACASINNKSKTANIKNNSWASNYLQSIGQPELSTSAMSKKANIVCTPDKVPEKKISKKLTNKEKMTQKPANKSMQPFEKEIKKQDDLHKRVTSLLSSIIPGTSQENLEKKANTQLTPILKNKTNNNANSGQNITLQLLKDKNINNLVTKRKHSTEKKNICINEYSPLVKRVNKNKGDSVNDSNIQSKKIRDKFDCDEKQHKGKDNLSAPNIHCKNDVFKDSNKIKNKPPKDYKSISSSSFSPCKKAKDIKHKSGLKKPSFKYTSNHKSEQNGNSRHKSYKSKNADITKVNRDSRRNKSKEKILKDTSFKKDKPDKHSESSTLDIKKGAKSTCKNQDTAGKTTTKKYVKSTVQTTDNFDFNIISKNHYKKQHEIEDLRIKLNRSHYPKKRDNLLVTVPNTSDHQIESNQQRMKMPKSSKDPKVKKIKLIINLICNKTEGKKFEFKEENKINENRQLASVDLSFLDDFNVDDIVESLNYEEYAPQLSSTDNQSDNKTTEPSNPLEDINERVIDVKIESMCSSKISKQTENIKLSPVNTDVFNYCDECKVKQVKLKDENEKEVKPDITKLDENSKTLIAPNKLHIYDTTSVSKADEKNSNAVIDKDIIIIDDMYAIGRENNDGSSKNTEDETKDKKDRNIEKKCLNDNSKINYQTSVKTEEITRYSRNIASSSETTLVDNNNIVIESTKIESPKCTFLTVKTSKNTIYDSLNKGNKAIKQELNGNVKEPNNKSTGTLDVDSKMDEQVDNMSCKTSYKGTETQLDVDDDSKKDGQVHNMSCKTLYDGTETPLDMDGDSKMDKQVNNNNMACKTKGTETSLDVASDSNTDGQVDNMSCKTSNKTSANAVENNVKVINNNTTSLHLKDLPIVAHLDTELSKTSKMNNPHDSNKSKGNINQNMSSLMKAVESAKVEDQGYSNVKQIKKSTLNSMLVGEENSVSKDPPNNLYKPYDAMLKRLLETRMHQYLGIKYDIRSIIHTGKYSKIFQCKDSNGKKYAVKVLKNTENRYSLGIKKEKMLKLLQRDIPKQNLNCVFLLNGFAIKDHWCFLMDYWPTNLEQVLKEKQKGFHICAVQNLARQLVSAVIVLRNNNIVHSDIKPGHILLNSSLDRLKVCGFDGFRYVDQVILLPNIGTASYRAPELILGHSDGFSVDVWSTALVMFEMATSKKLFSGIFNNDILYQQMCILGNVPFEMVQTSLYKEYHYCGTCFKRRSGYKGMTIVLISNFKTTPYIASTIFHAYDKYYGHSEKLQEKIHYSKLLRSLIQLLEQMLVLNPTCRIPIEFVYANEFIFT